MHYSELFAVRQKLLKPRWKPSPYLFVDSTFTVDSRVTEIAFA